MTKILVKLLTEEALADRLRRAVAGSEMNGELGKAVFNGFTFAEVKAFMLEAADRLENLKEELIEAQDKLEVDRG